MAAVVAVVFESDELAKLDDGAADLLIILRGGALPFLKVLEKFPFADPGCF